MLERSCRQKGKRTFSEAQLSSLTAKPPKVNWFPSYIVIKPFWQLRPHVLKHPSRCLGTWLPPGLLMNDFVSSPRSQSPGLGEDGRLNLVLLHPQRLRAALVHVIPGQQKACPWKNTHISLPQACGEEQRSRLFDSKPQACLPRPGSSLAASHCPELAAI